MSDHAHSIDPEELLAEREWLRGLAARLVGNAHDAEDVAQDALVTALQRAGPVRSMRAWLSRVVRSRAIDRHRSESRRSSRESAAREDAVRRRDDVPATDELVARADMQRRVAAAVMGLAEPYRTTVLLRWFEGLTPAEIAVHTGTPRETVVTRLRRAHTLLRQQLDSEFGGDRRHWCAVLLPFLDLPHVSGLPPPGTPPTGTPSLGSSGASLLSGAAAVSTNAKVSIAVLGVALFLAVIGGIAWWTGPGSGDPDAFDPSSAPAVDLAEAGSESEHEPTRVRGDRVLRGIVRRRADGRPVEGAAVTVTDTDGLAQTVTTSSDGSFAVLDLLFGTWHVEARARGAFAPAAREIAPRGDETDAGTIWLRSATRLEVTVENEHGDPVRGANVSAARRRPSGETAHVDSSLFRQVLPELTITGRESATTDERGVAVIERAASGGWVLFAATGDGRSRNRSVQIRSGTDVERIALSISPATTLTGTIVDVDGNTVADAWVGTNSTSHATASRTNHEGRFELRELPSGRVALRVGVHGPPGALLNTVQLPDVRDVTLQLPPTGRIEGRVLHESDGHRSGVLVAIEVKGDIETLLSTRSGADGSFTFEDVPRGVVTRVRSLPENAVHLWPRLEAGELVEPGPDGTTRRRCLVLPGETTRFDVIVIDGGVVTGRVVGPDGPVAGAHVYRWRKPTRAGQDWASTSTDDQGAFRLPPDLPGPVALEVRVPGLYQEGLPENVSSGLRKGGIPAEWMVEIPSSGEVRSDVTLVAGPPVAGRVIDAAGAPVAGAHVRVSAGYASPTRLPVLTGDDGRFLIPRVSPGQKRAVDAHVPHTERSGRERIDVVAGAEVRGVTIELSDATPRPESKSSLRRVEMRVVDDHSRGAIPHARVFLLQNAVSSADGSRRRWRPWSDAIVGATDDSGRVVVRVPEDAAHLSVTAPGFIEEFVTVAAATRDGGVVAMTPSSTLSGVALNADGSPLAHRAVVAVTESSVASYALSRASLVFRHPRKAITAADGTFTIRELGPGTHSVEVHPSPEYGASKLQVFGPFDAGRTDLELRLDAATGGALRVRVVHPDGRSADGARVQWSADAEHSIGRATIDAGDGRLVIQDLVFPVYSVRVTHGVVRVFRGLRPGKSEVELVLEPTETIEGRIVDAAGDPVVGATLSARPVVARNPRDLGWATAVADESGQFVLRCPGDAEYHLRIVPQDGEGGRRLLTPMVVRPGARDVQVGTTLEARISGMLVDAGGVAQPGRKLSLIRLHPEVGMLSYVPTAHTDESGRFTFSGVTPDVAWRVQMTVTTDGLPRWVRLDGDVRSGARNVRLTLPAGE